MITDKSNIPARSEEQWATIIRADLERSGAGFAQGIEGLISAGRNLEQAMLQLGKGNYGRMLESIGVDGERAKRLVRIATHATLTNPAYLDKLPLSMRTLSELARIKPPVLEGYIQDGKVCVEMGRAEAELLIHPDTALEETLEETTKRTPTPRSGKRSTQPNRTTPAEPKIEAWAKAGSGKPSADAIEAAQRKQTAEAIAEGKALEAKEADASTIDQLRGKNRALELENVGLKSEVEELKERLRLANPSNGTSSLRELITAAASTARKADAWPTAIPPAARKQLLKALANMAAALATAEAKTAEGKTAEAKSEAKAEAETPLPTFIEFGADVIKPTKRSGKKA